MVREISVLGEVGVNCFAAPVALTTRPAPKATMVFPSEYAVEWKPKITSRIADHPDTIETASSNAATWLP